MFINQELLKRFIFYFMVLTFFINIVNLINAEIYNNGEIIEYNKKISVEPEIMNEKDFCLKLKQPLGGMLVYRELFELSWLMIELSITIVIFGFILTISKKRILSTEYRHKLILFLPVIFFSWALLLYAWMGTVPAFYNCTKYFSL